MSDKIHLTAQVSGRLPEPDRQNVTRFCPKCGREIPIDRQLCIFCGNTGTISRPKNAPKRNFTVLISVITLMLILLAGLWLSIGIRETPTVSVSATQSLIRGTALPVIIITAAP